MNDPEETDFVMVIDDEALAAMDAADAAAKARYEESVAQDKASRPMVRTPV